MTASRTTASLSMPELRPATVTRAAAPVRSRVTASGWALAICALLLAGSGFPELRFKIGGLLVHPYLAVAIPLFVILATRRLGLIPTRILVTAAIFLVVFSFACLLHPGGVKPTVRLIAVAVTALAAVMAVRTEADFRMAAVAMGIAALVISLRGLLGSDMSRLAGINPMEGISNKNGFSLYTLPPLLLLGFMLLVRGTPRWQRVVAVTVIVVVVFASFSTANRSGWLGIITIVGMLSFLAARRVRTALVLVFVVGLATWGVSHYGNLRVIEIRMTKTQHGSHSDSLRLELFEAAMQAGLENPILGVGPQRIPYVIARRGWLRHPALETHNVFGEVFGGGGVLLSLALIALGGAMWLRKVRGDQRMRQAHFLLRAMIVLWCVRGCFTAEILKIPSFAMALAICVALCHLRGAWTPTPTPTPARR